MIENRFHEIGGPAIVQKEQELPKSPQRRRAKLVRTSETLGYAIGQGRPHVMNGEIRKRLKRPVAQTFHVGGLGGEARRVADVAAQFIE